jgi:Flp pilus assembly protein TadD
MPKGDGYKDYKGAIEDYNEAIRLKPDDADAYNNRGIAKSNLGDMAGACEDYRKSCSLGSSGSCAAAGSCK